MDVQQRGRYGKYPVQPYCGGWFFFAPTPGEALVALDAATGIEQWRFKGEGRPAFRGLCYWPGNADNAERLLISIGNDLWALNPKTGKPIGGFGEHGRLNTGEVRVAGAVHQNVLVLPIYAGDVVGVDVRTGAPLWRFHTVPQRGEYGADTWGDESGTGANCWGGMAMDEKRGIAYVSTGSPKPNFSGVHYHGQNLFANCVIALNALTGERLWHFQEIRHDIWDLDIPAAPNLVSIEREGKKYDAVAQVTKLGNTLLLDRVSGKPLFPFRMRRAPVSLLPGEFTWPYQPDVELPEPFARQIFSKDEITTRSPEAHTNIEHWIANARYGFFEAFELNRPTVLYNIHGGAEWTGAAYDPDHGRLYISANELPWAITVFQPEVVQYPDGYIKTAGHQLYETHCVKCHGAQREGNGIAPPLQGLARRTDDEAVLKLMREGKGIMPKAEGLSAADETALLDFLFLRDLPDGANVSTQEGMYSFNGYHKLLDAEGYPGGSTPWGTLNCLDLNSGKLLWKKPLGHYPDLAEWGEDDTGAENFGGATATAGGLVFCAGTPDNLIRAFDAENGDELWRGELPWGGYAPPISYNAGGKQFIAIAATGGGKLGTETGDAWVAFALKD